MHMVAEFVLVILFVDNGTERLFNMMLEMHQGLVLMFLLWH